ncbi:Uncharacterized protein PCOAH_00014100 [Plasmodium coatneyi]|uniref:LEM3/CDC50 family protein n=1 Tax=Plasmodium coatneyi TaxID=208452 RepID=A0A1B1DWZ4_9APIC|nr:Uncharacterized protein PCOAH_00014100 [Plasmodium coatneyi]ANQ07127.1 Uncharacterized protein PCOAH_00014100 [Plasmodium coatneyi]
METPETETEAEFKLISVNRHACEDILSSVKRRGRCVVVPVHGRPADEGQGQKTGQSQKTAQSHQTGQSQQTGYSHQAGQFRQTAARWPPPPQQINKKAVSFECKLLSKSSIGEDGTPVGGATYTVRIPTFEKKKSDNLFFRKKKSCIYDENKYNKFMEAFKQQELKKIKKFHHVYNWKVALVILLILAISFTLIGAFIYYESSHVIEVNIDYASGDKIKTFSVTHQMKQPVYVYYKISNFYSNFKTFLSDESQALVNDFKCKYIKTFEDIYRFRCVNGVQTLPEMNNDFAATGWGGKHAGRLSSSESCNINSIPSDQRKRKIFPCGLVSASIFNDKIRLSLKSKIFNIDKFPVLNYYDFFSYIKKHKKYGSDYKVWINTFSADYKNWFHPPMTSSFIKAYGVIYEDLEPGKDYKMEFTQNTWPAEHWKAKKSFQLVSLRAVGNSAYELAYSFFLLAIIYLIVIIAMLLLVKSGYYKLGKTFSYCKMSTVNNATEQTFFRKKSTMRKVEAAAGATTEESTRSSKGGPSPGEPDGQRSKESSNERVSRVVGATPRMCLCPLH